MPGDYIPSSDLVFQDWLGNFITVAGANLTAIGLTTTDIGPITTQKAEFDHSITESETAKAAALAATENKKTTRKSIEAKARALVKRIQAKADVPTDIKRQLQITVSGDTPAPPVKPYPPTNLTAIVAGSGVYELAWKKNGNSTVVLYSVEAKIGTATSFISVFTTKKLSYTHSGNAPGVKIVYQIRALHGETFSEPSNLAIVNDGISG